MTGEKRNIRAIKAERAGHVALAELYDMVHALDYVDYLRDEMCELADERIGLGQYVSHEWLASKAMDMVNVFMYDTGVEMSEDMDSRLNEAVELMVQDIEI